MIKSIPKSNISKRSFQVHKFQNQSDSDVPIIKATKTNLSEFDTGSASYVQIGDTKIYTGSLYSSIKSKYYRTDGNIFSQYGTLRNPVRALNERPFSDTIYVISIPQNKVGEGIKKGSLELSDNTNSIEYTDDGFGGIQKQNIEYQLVSADVQNNELILEDEFAVYELTLIDVDFNTGYLSVAYDSVIDNVTKVISTDFQENTLVVDREFELPFLLEPVRFGNVFYKDGLIVLTSVDSDTTITDYNVEFRSTSTIHETEVFLEVKEEEFNVSQNPSAVEVIVRNSYEFETTPIQGVLPSETITIREIEGIKKKTSFQSTYNPLITGSWDDYKEKLDTDPSGSYLAPFITTIGLYDDVGEMVAIAKLPTPIKSFPDIPVNFLIRIDT